MSTGLLVSILINNYNYGRFLREAIDSALNQTYAKIEVIVVDDGSTDYSREIIASYGDEIIPVLKENGGQASAFNEGLIRSKGKWIALLDSDDVFCENKIEELVRATKNYPSASFVAHNLAYINEHGSRINFGKIPICETKLIDARLAIRNCRLDVELPATSALFFKRSLLEQIFPIPLDVYDNYIKLAAVSLSPVLLVVDNLAKQRIHDCNFYTGRGNTEDGRINQAFVAARTAYRIRTNFPLLARPAWRMFGQALATLLISKDSEAKSKLSKIRSGYNLATCSPIAIYNIGGSLLKAIARKIQQSGM